MEKPEKNRFGYVYTVNNDSEEVVTPPEDQLDSMDVHMVDH
jgi:hypothetical protein